MAFRELNFAELEQVAGTGSPYDSGIVKLYEEFGGRDPTAAEIGVWEDQIANHGADLSTVRSAILADPMGQNQMVAGITATYQQYGGRTPTGDEIGVWEDQIQNHYADFSTVRNAILTDPLGQNYTTNLVNSEYRVYKGRDATADEQQEWLTGLEAGFTVQDLEYMHSIFPPQPGGYNSNDGGYSVSDYSDADWAADCSSAYAAEDSAAWAYDAASSDLSDFVNSIAQDFSQNFHVDTGISGFDPPPPPFSPGAYEPMPSWNAPLPDLTSGLFNLDPSGQVSSGPTNLAGGSYQLSIDGVSGIHFNVLTPDQTGASTICSSSAITSDLALLGPTVLQNLVSHNVTFACVPDSADQGAPDANLTSIHPRNWDPKYDYGDLPGTWYDPHNQKTVILSTSENNVGSSSFNVDLHETAHGYDQVNGFLSHSADFTAAYNQDVPLMTPSSETTGPNDDYYLAGAGTSNTFSGREEAFAEGFARYFANDSTLQTDWPSIYQYMLNHFPKGN